jgi:hypothetical protein
MARVLEIVKASPASTADAILDGLEAGREDIYPDPLSQQWGELFLGDPRALAREFAATVAAPANG